MPDRLDLHWLSMRCSRLKPRLVLHSSPDSLQDGSGICFLRYTTDVTILCFGILSWASSVTSWMPMFRIVLSLSERVSATVFCFVCLSVLFCFGHSPPPNKPKKFRRRPKGISTRSPKGLNGICRIKFLPCRWISKHGRVRQARLKWRWRTRRIRSDRLKWWLAGKRRANRGCSNSKTKSTPVKGLTLRDCVVARVKSVAACLLKMWTWFSTLDHDPYLGVRVGEATHPGLAGSRVTKRRRAAKQAAGLPGELVQQVVQAVFQALAQQGFRFPEQPKPAKKNTVKTEKEKNLNMPAPPPVPERVSFYPPTKGPGASKSVVGGASGADPPRMPKSQAQKTQTKSWVTVAATPSDQGRGRLLPSVWPLKAVQPVATVRKQLEEGVWPEGQVTWCHSKEEIDQLQALCKLHELPNQPFALGLRVDGVSSFTGGWWL